MDDATLVVFGANGDMARRLLFPALYELEQARRLGGLKIIAYARRDWSREQFLDIIRKASSSLPVSRLRRRPGSASATASRFVKGELNAADMKQLGHEIEGNAAFYLALPPDLFAPAATALAESRSA